MFPAVIRHLRLAPFALVLCLAAGCAPPVRYATDPGTSGYILSGECLVLRHDLGRDDLTFTAQFVKDGLIYDYLAFDRLFPAAHRVRGPVEIEDHAVRELASARTPDGNVIIAYQDPAAAGQHGDFRIYNERGELVAGPHAFAAGAVKDICIAPLADGRFFISYADEQTHGAFVIYTRAGEKVAGPTQFTNFTPSLFYNAAAAFPNGNVLLAYANGDCTDGTYEIYDPAGVRVAGPVAFTDEITQCAATTMTNGDVLLMISTNMSTGYPVFYRVNAAGVIVQSGSFGPGRPILRVKRSVAAASFPDGSLFIGYIAGEYLYDIFSPDLAGITTCRAFPEFAGADLAIVPFSRRDMLVAGSGRNSSFTVYDGFERRFLPPVVFQGDCDPDARLCASPLPNGGVLIACGAETAPAQYRGLISIFRRTSIDLEKVSRDEVRLWNRTGEPLEMSVMVNR